MIKGILIKKGLEPSQIRLEMQEIGVDPRGVEIMMDKFQQFTIRLFDLSFRQVAIMKQEMLARGAEAAISWKVCSWDAPEPGERFDVLLSGTLSQFYQFIYKLKQQPFKLPEIAVLIDQALRNYSPGTLSPVQIKGKSYQLLTKTYVMGIINLTPDSFSKDGLYSKENYIDLALQQAVQMVADGVDFLDIGAESSRPGAPQVEETEEERRLLPVIKELVKAVDVPISVDTYKADIAEKAVELGVSMINDIWGLQAPDDPGYRMAQVAAEAGVPVIIMHNKRENPGYRFLLKEIIESLDDSISIALNQGIKSEQILIDPGIGFAKTCQDNLQILRNLDQLKILGRPILLGVSRKSVIGLTLDLPVEERLEGTIASVIWGISKGANIMRVHDVKAVSRAIRMCDAIRQ
jgi:dihydropteroate synthase